MSEFEQNIINDDIETNETIEFIEDIETTNEFINIGCDLDIINEVKPIKEIINDTHVICASCKKYVKTYNTWNTLKKCFECKECNKSLY